MTSLNLSDNGITDPAAIVALVDTVVDHKPDLQLISGPLSVCINQLLGKMGGGEWEPPILVEAQDKAMLESLKNAIEVVERQNDLHGGRISSVSAVGLIMTMFLKEFMLELLDIGSDSYTYIEVKESKSVKEGFTKLYFGFFVFSVAASVCVQLLRIYLFRNAKVQEVCLSIYMNYEPIDLPKAYAHICIYRCLFL
jgi:hypothetical protein